jgi:methylamine dehydrogenase heavy chain
VPRVPQGSRILALALRVLPGNGKIGYHAWMTHRAKVAALGLVACLLAAAAPVDADVAPEELGQVARLPDRASDHWLWVPDRVLRHSILLDGDSGKMLGAVDSGPQITPKAPLWSHTRNEIYNVDTTYSRGHRGERHDYLVIYDSRTLEVKGEVEIPPKAADTGTGIALVGLLDGERFVVVLNQSPGASVSVIDVEARRVVGVVQTAGCAAVFPAGPTRFGMLCGDGTAITVHLTKNGELDRIVRSAAFFEVVEDPITEKGVRDGSIWWFASFGGLLYEVDFSGVAPVAKPPWPLFTDGELEDGWRIGGAQHLAYHPGTARLYSVVHRGGPGSHKDPGADIWVYDVAAKKKVDAFTAPSLIVAFLGPQAGFDAEGTFGKVLDFLLPNLGVHSIAVTQDSQPLLFLRNADLGAVGVLDALSGEHLRNIDETGLSGALLVIP